MDLWGELLKYYGPVSIYLVAIVHLWRKMEQERRRYDDRDDIRQAKYETLLDKVIPALARYHDLLESNGNTKAD
jgi:hypothetical protein